MKNRRRDFLKSMVLAVGAAAFSPAIVVAEERRRSGATGGELPLVKPSDSMAKALSYVHKNSDIKDNTMKTVRGGVAFGKQLCESCQFYTKDGKRGTDAVGKCQLFQGQVVKGSGWCNSWTKKA